VRQRTVKQAASYYHGPMHFAEQPPKHKKHWQELCAEAAMESNPEKADLLIEQIFALLQEREQRLKQAHMAR
jgi:hypothetical protein